MTGIIIREFRHEDLEQMWPIFHSVVSGGDTYDFSPDTTKEEAFQYFTEKGNNIFVADINGKVAGFYIFRRNRRGLGDHIGNCSYMVSPDTRGLGVGKKLGEHSIEYAKSLNLKGIQFNFVVSTNTVAVNLWKSIGFEIIGTIPQGYRHRKLGPVDAYIMFRKL